MCVVGRGPEERRLRQLAHQLGIADRVDFRGFVSAHVDVLRIMAASRVVVSASTVEGFGIVLLEAMALGVPFVASDIDPHREFLAQGAPGLLFPAGDAVELANAVRIVLEDARVAQRCRDDGRRLAPQYSWERVASLTEAVFASVVDEYLHSKRHAQRNRISDRIASVLRRNQGAATARPAAARRPSKWSTSASHAPDDGGRRR
ncbi:MAG: glycosyltransferase, partial [Acidimicrobiales bacterium]